MVIVTGDWLPSFAVMDWTGSAYQAPYLQGSFSVLLWTAAGPSLYNKQHV
jgi:hypothetical protein